jgi:site-specific DNA recombinase
MRSGIKKVQPAGKRAAIYCRVSTYNQGQGDFTSLDTQRQTLEGYAASKGWTVYDVYIDTKSGTTTERDELQRLLSDAKDRKFDVLLATKLDRLSRSMKDFFEINEALLDNNIDLAIATQQIDTTSSMGRFNRNVLMAFAEFERDMIAERTREKLYSQAQNGMWGGGHAPLGYDVKEKKLIVNPEEAVLVRRIFDYYLQEPSANKVSEQLNKQGYSMKTRTTKAGKKTGGTKFTKESVVGILRNNVYVGTIRYKNEQFQGIHEAIIDEKLFSRVQERLSLSAQDSHATTIKDSPLTLLGVTKCGFCGSLLSTSSTFKTKQQKRIYYYKCSKAAHHTKSHCAARDLPAEDLERLVLQTMQELVDNKELMASIVRQMEGNSGQDVQKLKDEVRQLNTNFGKARGKMKNLLLRASEVTVLRNSDVFKKDVLELEEQMKDIKEQVRVRERQLEKVSLQSVDGEILRDVMSKFLQIFPAMEKEQKRRLNQVIFASITSYFERGKTDGHLDFHIRGNGTLQKTWEDMKNPQVRTSGGFGSASRTRTYNPAVNSRMLYH